VCGEYPVGALIEEITTPARTPDETPVRALVTVAGNPVLSNPASEQLDAALGQLEVMISVDIYLNETTRHADVILPPPSALERSHYDVALLQLAVRNVANYSPPVFERRPGQPDEWEILAKLALIGMGQGPDADPAAVDDVAAGAWCSRWCATSRRPSTGATPTRSWPLLDAEGRRGPERMLDVMLRTGPYGDGSGRNPTGSRWRLLEAHPHGMDFGASAPRLPEVLRTPSGKGGAGPTRAAGRCRPAAGVGARASRGRRDALDGAGRSAPPALEQLVDAQHEGAGEGQASLHPAGAPRRRGPLGLRDGAPALVTSRVGEVEAPVEVTDAIRPGVVSLPHGWGHGLPGTRMAVAAEHAGVNSNVLTDHEAMDPLSGTSVLNGIPVTVAPVIG
jgi:anaerobic selenocysteine-containing dehydrogenase